MLLPTSLFAIIFIPWMMTEVLLPRSVLGMGDSKISDISSLAQPAVLGVGQTRILMELYRPNPVRGKCY